MKKNTLRRRGTAAAVTVSVIAASGAIAYFASQLTASGTTSGGDFEAATSLDLDGSLYPVEVTSYPTPTAADLFAVKGETGVATGSLTLGTTAPFAFAQLTGIDALDSAVDNGPQQDDLWVLLCNTDAASEADCYGPYHAAADAIVGAEYIQVDNVRTQLDDRTLTAYAVLLESGVEQDSGVTTDLTLNWYFQTGVQEPDVSGAEPPLNSDDDSIPDVDDNCHLVDNEDQADFDDDGVGDACDEDIDGDGFPNADDPDDFDPSVPAPDDDFDGVPNSADPEPNGISFPEATWPVSGTGSTANISISGTMVNATVYEFQTDSDPAQLNGEDFTGWEYAQIGKTVEVWVHNPGDETTPWAGSSLPATVEADGEISVDVEPILTGRDLYGTPVTIRVAPNPVSNPNEASYYFVPKELLFVAPLGVDAIAIADLIDDHHSAAELDPELSVLGLEGDLQSPVIFTEGDGGSAAGLPNGDGTVGHFEASYGGLTGPSPVIGLGEGADLIVTGYERDGGNWSTVAAGTPVRVEIRQHVLNEAGEYEYVSPAKAGNPGGNEAGKWYDDADGAGQVAVDLDAFEFVPNALTQIWVEIDEGRGGDSSRESYLMVPKEQLLTATGGDPSALQVADNMDDRSFTSLANTLADIVESLMQGDTSVSDQIRAFAEEGDPEASEPFWTPVYIGSAPA